MVVGAMILAVVLTVIIVVIIDQVVEVVILPMHGRVVTVFTLAEHPATHAALAAFAVFLDTVSFSALASLLHLLDLKPQTECVFLLLILFLLFFLVHRLEPMRVPGQRLDDRLLVLCGVLLVIAAVVAVAVLVAEYLLLETFAVQLQAFRPFAVAPKLALTHHVVIFLVN